MKQSYSHKPFSGAPFTTYDIFAGQLNTHFSSDPTVDFLARWGVTSLPDDSKVLTYLDLAVSVFGGYRDAAVLDAQQLCFPNAGTTPVCDPNDAKVKALSTARLDQGLRILRTLMRDTYTKASPGVKSTVATRLKNMTFEESFCTSNDCSMYELLLGPVDHWAAMTSNADSPVRQRYGY